MFELRCLNYDVFLRKFEVLNYDVFELRPIHFSFSRVDFEIDTNSFFSSSQSGYMESNCC